ncbi:uncharacterized protein LOC107042164 [Diachasma alloeum]|uniref:uncharacterized protein LOC107042164 n=1 Tax=Diachasma alloeum TaxID=454923 RepID=UPI0007382568|nr:uncharacterized protein LOC107042164 [Diachasma alloeum]
MDGSSMGNPASPVLAGIVMDYVILEVLEKLPCNIPWLKLYVDDTVLPVPEDSIDMIHRMNDGSLKLNWYQKPTSSGRVINYQSNHLMAHKVGVVFGMLHRAIGLSHEDFHEANIDRVKDTLTKNGYPGKFVMKCVREFKNRRASGVERAADPDARSCFRFPLVRGLSQRLNRCLRSTDSKLVFYNLRSVGDLYSKLKDPIPLLPRSEVVYKIPCECDNCYIGQTRQRLGARIRQHRYDCAPRDLLKKEKTALATHCFDKDHRFKFEDVSILDTESHWVKRNIAEMIHICLHDTTTNLAYECHFATFLEFLDALEL